MNDKMINALKQVLEYRPSMPIEVLHSWAADMKKSAQEALTERPAQQQQPVATVVHTCKPGDYATIHTTVALQKGQTVYTSPHPSKPWVGLTDEDVRKINQEVWGYVSADHTRMWNYARAIEAKLRERNGGGV